MVKINLKPLSVNAAYRGRRYRTNDYIEYERTLMYLLPKMELPPPPFEIYFKFGFSSLASDWDNCIKTTQDIISKKYGFNDRLIIRGVVETEQVSRGQEYFIFEIKRFERN